MKWNNNTCRHDCFFFLFTYLIYPNFGDNNIVEICILKILINIYKELFSNNLNIVKIGIWKLLEKYKNYNFDLTTAKTYYKQFNSFLHTINLLNGIPEFSLQLNSFERYNLPTEHIKTSICYNPIIEININILNLIKNKSEIRRRFIY